MNKVIKSFAVVAVLVLTTSSTLVAGPKFELSEGGFDFGRTIQHVKVNHTFIIRSVGDDTLRITNVIPGCGCTKAPLADSVLAPGDSTRLEIFFSTRSFKGKVSKRPYFTTNINNVKKYIAINAELLTEREVMFPIAITPTQVDVSQFSEKPRRKAKYLIENRSDIDYKLTLVDTDHKSLGVKLPKMVKAGETVGQIVVNEDAIGSEFEESFTFKLDDADGTRYTVPIKRMLRIKSGK